MKPWHILLATTMALLWGFGFVTSKYAAGHMPPLFFLALRFIAVSLLLVWFVRVPRGQLLPVMLFACSMGAGHFGLFYIALDMGVEASTAAIIWQTQVPMTVLLAALLLNDRPSWVGILGIVVAFGGVFVLVGEPRHFGNLFAIGLALASCVAWAVANIQAKKLTSVAPLALNAWMSVFSAIILLAHPRERSIGALLGAGLAPAWLARLSGRRLNGDGLLDLVFSVAPLSGLADHRLYASGAVFWRALGNLRAR